MSAIKTTELEGDLSIGRNVSAGGTATVQGKATVYGNLVVKGWLDAKNIKGANKGIFKDETSLKESFPLPHDGWWAVVLKSTTDDDGNVTYESLPGELWIADGGEWVNSGAESGEIEADISAITDAEEQLATLQDAVESNATSIAANAESIASNAENITTLQGSVASNADNIQANADSISTLQGSVATNTNDISTLQGSVASNTDNIQANADSISTLQESVATNTSSIKTNADDITALQESVAALGGALVYKGYLRYDDSYCEENGYPDDSSTCLPYASGTEVSVGWFYLIFTAGCYAGYDCSVGDALVCIQAHTCVGDTTTMISDNWAKIGRGVDVDYLSKDMILYAQNLSSTKSELLTYIVGLTSPSLVYSTNILRPDFNVTEASEASVEGTFTVECEIAPASVSFVASGVTYEATVSGTQASATFTILNATSVTAKVTYADTDSTTKSVSATFYVSPEFYYGCSSADFTSSSLTSGTGGRVYTSFAGKSITTTEDMTCICLAIPAYLFDTSKTYYATIGAAKYPFTALSGTYTGISQDCDEQEYKILVYDTYGAGTYTIVSMSLE